MWIITSVIPLRLNTIYEDHRLKLLLELGSIFLFLTKPHFVNEYNSCREYGSDISNNYFNHDRQSFYYYSFEQVYRGEFGLSVKSFLLFMNNIIVVL